MVRRRPISLTRVKIETERLCFTPISMKYKKAIFKEFTPEISAYMYVRPPEKIQETQAFITQAIKELQSGVNLQTVILKKSSHLFLGCAGLHHTDTRTPELGIWLKKSAHKHKYGQEAMRALKAWADAHLTYDYIRYPVAQENRASRAIAELLGGEIMDEYTKTNLSGATLNILEYWIRKDRNPTY